MTAAAIRAAEASGDVEALAAALHYEDYDSDTHTYIDDLAAGALGRVQSPEALDALLAAAGDPKLRVRGAVATMLGERADRRALPALLELAEHDEEIDVRLAATDALGGFRDPELVPRLIAILQTPYEELPARSWRTSPKEDLRAAAIHALGRLGDARAVEALIGALTDKPAVAQAAASALVRIDDERAVAPLSRWLGDAGALRAADALDEVAQFLEHRGRPGVKQLLIAAYERGEPAGTALARYGGEDVYELFATSLRQGNQMAAFDLAKLGDARGVERVAERFGAPENAVSPTSAARFAQALVNFGEPGIQAMLDSFAKVASDDYLRQAAADALRKMGDDRAIEVAIPNGAERSRLAKLRQEFEAIDYAGSSEDELAGLLREHLGWMSRNEDRYASLRHDFEAHSIPVVAVGRQLFERGGEALMRDVLGRMPQDYRRYVEREWSGIGSWMG